MSENEKLNDHVNFKELAAWATLNVLTASEWVQLKDHLQICDQCREVYRQYMILAAEGIPLLATQYNHQEEPGCWDDTLARRKLFDRIRFQPTGILFRSGRAVAGHHAP